MTRGKSEGGPLKTLVARVIIVGQGAHADSAGHAISRALERLKADSETAMRSPQEHMRKALAMLCRAETRTEAVLMVSDAIDAKVDISDGIPLLKKYLPAMEPIAQDLALAVILYHHSDRQEDSEIVALLRHKNPRYARNAADYMSVRAFSGLDVSRFVPELVKMVYHKDPAVARSAYNAIEAAAILTGDETAVLFLKAVYSQGIAES